MKKRIAALLLTAVFMVQLIGAGKVEANTNDSSGRIDYMSYAGDCLIGYLMIMIVSLFVQ